MALDYTNRGVAPVLGIANIVGGSFTTPAGTSAYASGNLIANSATAGSVVPIPVTAARANDATGLISRVRVMTADTGAAGASVRVHLYRNQPTCSNGDHGAWLTNESTYIGSFDVVLDKTFTDFVKGVGIPTVGSFITFDPSAGTQLIYALVEARSIFTPQGSKLWNVAFEVAGVN